MCARSIAGLVAVIVLGSWTASKTMAAAPQSQRIARMLDGEEMFQAYCASCHGRSGKGDGPAARALKTRPADLTQLARRGGGTFPRERIGRLLANGEPSTPAHGSKEMPVWGPLFEGVAPGSFQTVNPRIEDVVRYVESIQAK
jgi:mono/diheme cytochrome c family protein